MIRRKMIPGIVFRSRLVHDLQLSNTSIYEKWYKHENVYIYGNRLLYFVPNSPTDFFACFSFYIWRIKVILICQSKHLPPGFCSLLSFSLGRSCDKPYLNTGNQVNKVCRCVLDSNGSLKLKNWFIFIVTNIRLNRWMLYNLSRDAKTHVYVIKTGY